MIRATRDLTPLAFSLLLVLQRLLIFLGLLALLTFIAALFVPPNLTVPVTTTTVTTPKVTAPKPKPKPKPTALTPEPTAHGQIFDGPHAKFTKITATVGDTVTLSVTGPVTDVAAISSLGLTEPVAPDLPSQIIFYADEPGTFTVSLLAADRVIGEVSILPKPRRRH